MSKYLFYRGLLLKAGEISLEVPPVPGPRIVFANFVLLLADDSSLGKTLRKHLGYVGSYTYSLDKILHGLVVKRLLYVY